MSTITAIKRVLHSMLALLVLFVALPTALLANERVINSPQTRLALFGYDAVAYLADERASLGSEDYELLYQNLVWRFQNDANRAAFVEAPDLYSPAYGGYDLTGIADGRLTAGHPEIYLVIGNRVYFFATAASRLAFSKEPERLLARASDAWPRLREALAR